VGNAKQRFLLMECFRVWWTPWFDGIL